MGILAAVLPLGGFCFKCTHNFSFSRDSQGSKQESVWGIVSQKNKRRSLFMLKADSSEAKAVMSPRRNPSPVALSQGMEIHSTSEYCLAFKLQDGISIFLCFWGSLWSYSNKQELPWPRKGQGHTDEPRQVSCSWSELIFLWLIAKPILVWLQV